MAKAGICHDTSCLLCNIGEDSCQHLFFQCPCSVIVSQKVMGRIGIYNVGQENLYLVWKKWGRKFKNKKRHKLCYSVIAAVVYHIWRARNHALWNDVVMLPDVIIRNIQLDVCGRYKSLVDIKWNVEDKLWFHQLVSSCNN